MAILKATKYYKVKIEAAVEKIMGQHSDSIGIMLFVVIMKGNSDLYPKTNFVIQPMGPREQVYTVFGMPPNSNYEAIIGSEGYAEVCEALQLNNIVGHSIKRFISEQEYEKLVHLNDKSPSPQPLHPEAFAKFKAELVEKGRKANPNKPQAVANPIPAKLKAIAKNKPKTSKHNHQRSTGPTMAELIELEQKHKENNNSDTVEQHKQHRKKVARKPLTFEEALAQQSSKRFTAAGPIAAYALVQAKQQCAHKNSVSIKNFR